MLDRESSMLSMDAENIEILVRRLDAKSRLRNFRKASDPDDPGGSPPHTPSLLKLK